VHSHRCLLGLVQAQQYVAASRIPEGMVLPPARILTTTPLFHVSGLHSGVVAGLGAGATTVWVPGRFDPDRVAATIERERITSWTSVPTLVWRLLSSENISRYDCRSLRHIGGGGAPWSPALQERMREVFGPSLTWGVGYGLTEATGLATTAGFADLAAHPDTVGRPVPTVDLEVRDGEIWLRGPLVMLGYWNDPVATAAVIGAGRWLRTGDLGTVREGLLFLSSRRTDLILRGAENVYPAEIENCLEEHPDVAEAAVVGLPDDDLGQRVAAVVVPVAGAVIDPQALRVHVAGRLAYFKVPAEWLVRTDPLPRTETGKVIRAEVIGEVVKGIT
jgi:acyl-CoA synthetase (AMP-forming)/AMP-acid ligase II